MPYGGEEWFMHTLVLQGVGGRTVAELKANMGAGEFERWRQYYLMSPFDDRHRYYRPAAMTAAVAGKIGKGMDYFMDILEPPRRPAVSDVDMSIMKAFGVKPRRK